MANKYTTSTGEQLTQRQEENWVYLFGSDGLYEVSNMGRIQSTDTYIVNSDGKRYFRKGRIIKQKLNQNGYLTVHLSINGKSKHLLVHRCVMLSFKPINETKDCNHKNGIKTDNRLENLEWVTKSQNTKHAYLNGLMKAHPKTGDECVFSVLKGAQVKTIKEDYNNWVNSISERYGVHRQTILSIINNKSWRKLIELKTGAN